MLQEKNVRNRQPRTVAIKELRWRNKVLLIETDDGDQIEYEDINVERISSVLGGPVVVIELRHGVGNKSETEWRDSYARMEER